MDKILVFSDLHAGVYTRFNKDERLSDLEKCLDYILQYIIKENVRYVVFLGDLFERKNLIETECISIISQKFFKISKVAELFVVDGNHDVYSKSFVTDILPFATIFHKPEKIEIAGYDVLFVPFTKKINFDLLF